MEERDWSTGSTTFDCHLKCMESWVGTKPLFYCSGCNTSTLFLNLVYRERESLDTLPTMVDI